MSSMEHRCSQRLFMELPAIVHQPGGPDVPVTIRNLSTGGAFIAVSADRSALRGVVELELAEPGGDPVAFVWRAWVIRQERDGVGLMFDDRQLDARHSFLAEILKLE